MKLEMFPLLTFSFVIYAVLTLTGITGGDGKAWYEALLVNLPLASGEKMGVTGGDAFLVVSMGLLFVELIRATKTGAGALINNLLSFLLFIGVLLSFIFVPGFGTSTFFIFMTMTLLDPMAGSIVTTQTARRDLALSDPKRLLG